MEYRLVRCLLDLPLVNEEGRCGPHLLVCSFDHGPLIKRLPTARHLSYLGVLVFCLDSSTNPSNPAQETGR
jgi:hypothetical protein